jgi:D-proline reductase (dithiol) PrdB
VGDLSEFSLRTRLFLQAYPWRRVDPVPWTPLRMPLGDAQVAIISSAGLVLPEQPRFDETARGGDWTWRAIPGDTDPARLVDTHRSGTYDHHGVASDPNLAFPLDRLRELARERVIGRVANRHFSFMGSITAPSRLRTVSAPEVAEAIVADGTDVVLLIPI